MITFIDEEIKTQNNPMHCLNPYQKVKMNSNPVNVIPQSLDQTSLYPDLLDSYMLSHV